MFNVLYIFFSEREISFTEIEKAFDHEAYNVGWLVGFYSILTFVGYLMTNLFYANSSISNNSV